MPKPLHHSKRLIGSRALANCEAMVERARQEGCRVAAFLHDGLKAIGYRGSKRTVRRFVERWRTAAPPPPVRRILPGPQTLCWLLLRRRSELDDAERVLLTDLCRRSSELATSRRLAQEFMLLVRERRGTQLDGWIAEVQSPVRQSCEGSAAIFIVIGRLRKPDSPCTGVPDPSKVISTG